MAGPLGQLRVADPLRRDEDDDVEDGRADGEDAPQDGDRARVSACANGFAVAAQVRLIPTARISLTEDIFSWVVS